MKKSNPNIERYAALSAAFLGTAVAANAGVVYTDIDPDAAAITSMDTIDIDMNNDGIVDFQFRGISTSFSSTGTYPVSYTHLTLPTTSRV